MAEYIRFGKLPKDGRSINYLKLTFEEMEDIEINGCPEHAKEKGVSVFEIANGRPLLKNLKLISTLHSRVREDYPAYIVQGEEVGKGADGEPLLSNVHIVKKYEYKKNEMFNYIITTLSKKYRGVSGEKNNNIIFGTFRVENKRNIKTGEIVSIWENFGADGYENLPPYTELVCNGMTFWNPVDGFDTEL